MEVLGRYLGWGRGLRYRGSIGDGVRGWRYRGGYWGRSWRYRGGIEQGAGVLGRPWEGNEDGAPPGRECKREGGGGKRSRNVGGVSERVSQSRPR